MKIVRIPLALGIILVFAAMASAQKSQCALRQSPSFRGFHLGMTPLDIRSKLEDTTLFDISAPQGRPGSSQAVRISAAELKEDIAEGIDEINLAFVDGKLALIKVTFTDATSWDSGQDFLLKTSEVLGLPKPVAGATTGDKGNEKYRVVCTGFAVALSYSFGVSPNFTINDIAAQKIADERLDNDKEIRRITISPNTTTHP